MTEDVKLAWLFTRGSDRREWWRFGLTAVGALCATGFAAAAAALASLGGVTYRIPYGDGLFDRPGERTGVILALFLLLLPTMGFLGQCARVGAVHRDRRMAGLRLAGASARRVRRIAALETGLACLAGSVLAALVVGAVVLSIGVPSALLWVAVAAVALLVPVAGALVSVVALRRVVASPLGEVRRERRPAGRRTALQGVVAVAGAIMLGILVVAYGGRIGVNGPVALFVAFLLIGLGAVWVSGSSARLLGGRLAGRTEDPAVLIAAERLRDDPWAAARTHAAVLLITVVATGYMGIRQAMMDDIFAPESSSPQDVDFYVTGLDLTAAAVGIGLLITLAAVAVGAAEGIAARRQGLAEQVAAGVPRHTLSRALLLETALPLAPAVGLAAVGGLAVGTFYATAMGGGGFVLPWTALPVPFAVYATCLLAAATAMPLLRRTARPSELRHA
ncbi:ABC transporter permease [Streptomyces abyssomicinicus]|uniref:ABC transporter permease n=1 Tax=Streptomyces abyssomicinicus TaxID=574929 RepID=UPI001250AA1C|nr:ABC transporter permease [Streptomyces abyssomicinicus]